jgi:uncharacterized protein YndB with AHSA1/START domain
MTPKIQNGYLTLADISGYTSFMAQTELEHSQAILSDFLHLVIENLTPMFRLAEVEGDAVFVYAPESGFSRGETMLEIVEATYYNFRRHRDIMIARTTCTCRACKSIPQLDLKFITHFGSFALQTIAGSEKPVGSDVNIAHRLLKNNVSGKTGWHAYALFSESAVRELNVSLDNPHSGTENYEHLGDIEIQSYDLTGSLNKLSGKLSFRFDQSNCDFHLSYDFPVSKARLWQLLNDPESRGLWMEGTKWEKGERPKGRTDIGASNHCYHGKDLKGLTTEIIRDWKPFDYLTTESGEKPLLFFLTQELEAINGGTRLHAYIKIKNKLPNWLKRKLAGFIARKGMKIEKGWTLMSEILGEELKNPPQADGEGR